ncbi:hypothetical protein KPL74_17430 [Bacillus sp. NP157]|nr:hypothetical protein KPL74_17430 [Bacillus sp. NP157]
MTRHRWMAASWPMDASKLAKGLRTNPFDPERASGFVVDRVRKTYVEARYVERLEFDITDIDPFGEEFTTHQIQYKQYAFVANTGESILEMVNEPRSSNVLISSLSEVCGFRLTVEQSRVDALQWLRLLERNSGEAWRVESLQLSGIRITPSISAKAVLSGTGNVVDSVSDLVGRKPHTIDKIKARRTSDRRGAVILARDAVASVQGFGNEEQIVVQILRDTLGQAVM